MRDEGSYARRDGLLSPVAARGFFSSALQGLNHASDRPSGPESDASPCKNKRRLPSRLRRNSEKQISRRLKPPRNDKIKELIGTSELVPFPKHVRHRVFPQPAREVTRPAAALTTSRARKFSDFSSQPRTLPMGRRTWSNAFTRVAAGFSTGITRDPMYALQYFSRQSRARRALRSLPAALAWS
jgi:hypothetical protein